MERKKTGKKITFVTGTRADFGKQLPLALAAADAGFQVTFFVTGMHMMASYGETRNEVRRHSRFEIVEFINHRHGDRPEETLAKTLLAFSDWINEKAPDLVIVHGDRVESLACSLACSTNYVPCAHIEGGEVSGTIDEVYRHCITKLNTVHFVASEAASDRVRRLGEDPTSIYLIGSPELDIHSSDDVPSLSDSKARYGIRYDAYGILLFHSVTSELDSIAAQAFSLFRAVSASEKPFICIASNNDPGSDLIMDVARSFSGDLFKIIPSIRFEMFSRLLRNAAIVVGNSSLGVREAPFLGIPSINVGTRQTNRSDCTSVVHVNAGEIDLITNTILDRWGRRFPCDGAFGVGNARARFIEVISDPSFWNFSKQKLFID